MYGIDNLKKMVKFACDFTKQVATSSADGWNWTDLFSFVDEAQQVPGIVEAWPEVKQEIAELDETEREELHAYVVAEFDIPNDEVESLIEDSLAWVVATVALVGRWKNK